MILPMEYMAGAKAGHKKLWCELRIPITSPLTPKNNGRYQLDAHQINCKLEFERDQ